MPVIRSRPTAGMRSRPWYCSAVRLSRACAAGINPPIREPEQATRTAGYEDINLRPAPSSPDMRASPSLIAVAFLRRYELRASGSPQLRTQPAPGAGLTSQAIARWPNAAVALRLEYCRVGDIPGQSDASIGRVRDAFVGSNGVFQGGLQTISLEFYPSRYIVDVAFPGIALGQFGH